MTGMQTISEETESLIRLILMGAQLLVAVVLPFWIKRGVEKWLESEKFERNYLLKCVEDSLDHAKKCSSDSSPLNWADTDPQSQKMKVIKRHLQEMSRKIDRLDKIANLIRDPKLVERSTYLKESYRAYKTAVTAWERKHGIENELPLLLSNAYSKFEHSCLEYILFVNRHSFMRDSSLVSKIKSRMAVAIDDFLKQTRSL